MKTRKHGINGIISLIALTITACISTPEPNKDTKPKAGDIIVSSTGIELVYIPAGTFTMGSPASETEDFANPYLDNERLQHQVTLSAFYMGKYEVTQEQYQTVMGTNPSDFSSEPADGEMQGKRPVEQVTWYDTIEFCNALSVLEGLTPYYNINKEQPDLNNTCAYDPLEWLITLNTSADGYRLPTEAQWEYACRAGTTTAYNTGARISDSTGWYDANGGEKTHEVGKKTPNAWGLYDMHGNVFEWCWDWYGSYSSRAQTDPQGTSSGSDRVFRGGYWFSSAGNVRSARRNYSDPSDHGRNIGLRAVRPVQ